jgi:hypothetical protein
MFVQISVTYVEPPWSSWRWPWVGTHFHITINTYVFVMLYHPGRIVVQPKEITSSWNRNQRCLVCAGLSEYLHSVLSKRLLNSQTNVQKHRRPDGTRSVHGTNTFPTELFFGCSPSSCQSTNTPYSQSWRVVSVQTRSSVGASPLAWHFILFNLLTFTKTSKIYPFILLLSHSLIDFLYFCLALEERRMYCPVPPPRVILLIVENFNKFWTINK